MSRPPTTAAKDAVPGAFDRAARRYDLLCALNPGYRAHLRRSARRMELSPGSRVLDLCCGTGLSTAALLAVGDDLRVVGLDASPGMLAVARAKSGLRAVDFVLGDAADPRAAGVEGPFDGILMAYGIRNLPDPDRGLCAIRDLLAPGGVVCFHEYSVADSRVARGIWNAVAATVIVPLGRLFTGSAELFRYLRSSVNEFDGVEAFEGRLRAAGFTDVRTLPHGSWQRGIVHSFLARRPHQPEGGPGDGAEPASRDTRGAADGGGDQPDPGRSDGRGAADGGGA